MNVCEVHPSLSTQGGRCVARAAGGRVAGRPKVRLKPTVDVACTCVEDVESDGKACSVSAAPVQVVLQKSGVWVSSSVFLSVLGSPSRTRTTAPAQRRVWALPVHKELCFTPAQREPQTQGRPQVVWLGLGWFLVRLGGAWTSRRRAGPCLLPTGRVRSLLLLSQSSG